MIIYLTEEKKMLELNLWKCECGLSWTTREKSDKLILCPACGQQTASKKKIKLATRVVKNG
jgi:hypothetical protein